MRNKNDLSRLEREKYLKYFEYLHTPDATNNPYTRAYEMRLKKGEIHPDLDRLSEAAFAHFALKKIYQKVDHTNPQHREAFLAQIEYRRTGKLPESSDARADLAIAKIAMEKRGWVRDVLADGISAVGEILSDQLKAKGVLGGAAYVAGKVLGPKLVEEIRGDNNKEMVNLSKQLFSKHGIDSKTVNDFLDMAPSDPRISLALVTEAFHGVKQVPDLLGSMEQRLKDYLSDKNRGTILTKEVVRTDMIGILGELSGQFTKQISTLSDSVVQLHTDTKSGFEEIKDLLTRRPEYQFGSEQIKGLAETGQFLGHVAQFTGSTALGNAAKIAVGVAEISSSMSQLGALAAMANPGVLALTGGYAAVGIAVFSLASSFMGQEGPSPEEVILNFLQEMFEFIGKEFDRVHEHLQVIHEDMTKGFSQIKKACQSIFDLQLETLKEIHALRGDLHDLKQEMQWIWSDIKKDVEVLQTYVSEALKLLTEEDFTKANRDLRNAIKTGDYVSIQKISQEVISNILEKSKQEFYTGQFYLAGQAFAVDGAAELSDVMVSPLKSVDSTDLSGHAAEINRIRLIHKDDPTSLLGLLVGYAERLLDDSHKLYSLKPGIRRAVIEDVSTNERKKAIQEAEERVKQDQGKRIDNANTELTVQQVVVKKTETEYAAVKKEIRLLCSGLQYIYNQLGDVGSLEWVALYRAAYSDYLKSELCAVAPNEPHDHQRDSIQGGLRLDWVNQAQISLPDGVDPNEVYAKALSFIEEWFHQKSMLDLARLALSAQEHQLYHQKAKYKLGHPLTYRSFSTEWIFSPRLWAESVSRLLELLENPQARAAYRDPGLENVQEIIQMGENYGYLFHSLRDSEALFTQLWKNYANAVVRIHRHYYRQWEVKLGEKYTEPHEWQAEVTQLLLTPNSATRYEVEFAKFLMTEPEFKNLLSVVDAAQFILNEFLLVMNLPDDLRKKARLLWTSSDIIIQFASISSGNKAQAPILDFRRAYTYLNDAYVTIRKLKVLGDYSVNDPYWEKTIAYLTDRLRRFAGAELAQVLAKQMELLPDKVSEKKQDFSQLPTKRSTAVKDEFSCLIDSALKNANMKDTDDAVLYFGITRGGKSTFINYSLGCEVEYFDDGVSDTEIVTVKTCPPGRYPTIGYKPKAHTLFPGGYQQGERTHVDFPGLDGSRGDEEMLGVLATQVAIKTIRHVKQIVVVASVQDIAGKNAKNLSRLVSALAKIFDDLDKYKEYITLVVTKVQGYPGKTVDAQKERVIRALKQFDEVIAEGHYISEIGEDNVQNVRNFLQIFTKAKNHDNIVMFHLDNQAKDELTARVSASKGFTSAYMQFFGDKDHAQRFHDKVQGELSDAIKNLNFLDTYAEKKENASNEVENLEKQLTDKGRDLKELKDKKIGDDLPHKQSTIDAKSEEKFESSKKVGRLEAEITELKKAVAEILSHKDEVVKHRITWDEKDHYPDNQGTFAIRSFSGEQVNKGKMSSLEEKYAVDCDQQLKGYICFGSPGNVGLRSMRPEPNTYQTKDGKIHYASDGSVVFDPDGGYSYRDDSDIFRTVNKGRPKRWVNHCSNKGAKGLGAQGSADIIKDESKGTYQITYQTPEYCYGSVDVSFSVHYLDQPPIIKELEDKRSAIKDKDDRIVDEEAKQKQLQLDNERMRAENDAALKKAGEERVQRERELVKLEASVNKLKKDLAKATKALRTLNDQHAAQKEYFCTSKPLWDKLAELHGVIQFPFKDYEQFSTLYQSVVVKITPEDCEAYPIDDTVCKTYTNDDTTQYRDFEESASCPGGANALTVSSTWVQEPRFAGKHYDFDYGRWDTRLRRHPYTHAPIFTYRVFSAGHEVGSTEFYQHPLLCGNPEGTRNNVLSATGELADVEFPVSGIEICDSLQPTQNEILLDSAYIGARMGGLRGISDALAGVMREQGFSQPIVEQAKQCLFYACFWLMRCCAYGAEGVSVESLFRALVETLSLFIVSRMIQAVSGFIKREAEHMKVSVSKCCLNLIGDNLGYASYLYSSSGFGIAPVAASLVAGLLSQMMVAKCLGVLLTTNPACLLLASTAAFSVACYNGVAEESVLPLAVSGIFAAKAVTELTTMMNRESKFHG